MRSLMYLCLRYFCAWVGDLFITRPKCHKSINCMMWSKLNVCTPHFPMESMLINLMMVISFAMQKRLVKRIKTQLYFIKSYCLFEFCFLSLRTSSESVGWKAKQHKKSGYVCISPKIIMFYHFINLDVMSFGTQISLRRKIK